MGHACAWGSLAATHGCCMLLWMKSRGRSLVGCGQSIVDCQGVFYRPRSHPAAAPPLQPWRAHLSFSWVRGSERAASERAAWASGHERKEKGKPQREKRVKAARPSPRPATASSLSCRRRLQLLSCHCRRLSLGRAVLCQRPSALIRPYRRSSPSRRTRQEEGSSASSPPLRSLPRRLLLPALSVLSRRSTARRRSCSCSRTR